jgi:hypothetical protein
MVPPPVSQNTGYGLDYDEEAALAEMLKEHEEKLAKKVKAMATGKLEIDSDDEWNQFFIGRKNEQDVDDSVDSHPSETEWLIPQYNAWQAGKENNKMKEEESVDIDVAADNKKTKDGDISDIVKDCDFCNSIPCVLKRNNLFNELVALAEEYEDSGLTNKQIRFEMYSTVSKKLFGRLGHGVRKKIPHCVEAEIHDMFPEKKVIDYIGFKEGTVSDTESV